MFISRTILGVGLLLLAIDSYAQQETFLLVSSRGTNSVRMYDAKTGAFIRNWAPPGIGGLDRPQEVIYGPDGQVYVSGIGTPVILKFDGKTGEYLGPFTSGYDLDSPTKISWGPDGLMYVSQWGIDNGQRNVVRFDPVTGMFIDEFTSDNPIGTCDQDWDSEGNMYLASFGETRVIKYDPEGNRVGYFTPAQPVQGPVDLYWARNGDLMVVDWNNGQVNAHDGETGAFKRTFIQGMINTEGITMGPDGRLYAADWSANEIKTYSALTGQGGAVFIGGDVGLVNPNALIFGPQEAVTSTSQEVPDAFSFHIGPNFPNPFQAHTTIPFFAEHAGPILLKVFDLQGRLVTSMSTNAAAGAAELEMDASSLISGRYAYSLELDGQVRNGLMIKR